MKKIKIALLDSGIADELLNSVDVIGTKQFYYDYYSEKVFSDDKVTDYNGHGSSCVDTITGIFPHVCFYIIKMLGIGGVTNAEVFEHALEFVSTLDVDIIALCSSFICECNTDKINALLNKINSNGKIITASVQNGLESSFPADNKNVIGVIGGLMDDRFFCFNEKKSIQMQCSCNEVSAKSCYGINSVFQGNSRATAIATAIIAESLFESADRKFDINEILKEKRSSCEFLNTEIENEYDCIEEVVFDAEKEKYYIENDENYHRLIYLLCEFFFTEDTSEVRTAYLPDYKDRLFLRKLGNMIGLIKERFKVEIDKVYISDLQWAYLFYEKYIRREL